jgi:hypothetical protein
LFDIQRKSSSIPFTLAIDSCIHGWPTISHGSARAPPALILRNRKRDSLRLDAENVFDCMMLRWKLTHDASS